MNLHAIGRAGLLLAPALTLFVPAALAEPPQSELQRVEISSQKTQQPRYDVTENCPTIADKLPVALGHDWYRIQKDGTVYVEFTLSEGRPGEIRSSGGPRDYYPAIRKAMRNLDCKKGGAPERFAFEIVFRDEWDQPIDERPRPVAFLKLR
ncbi:hypothetical protein [Pelomonas sp. SE-A7]|uniref:hypothetical protein n=1 Tax=Pelomonas sp. SE-A7 TaxID=3054953 RepID=UPI00259CEEFA|nr:hypothetical protein [Pelomonas sp. SE-A7]MDM4767768.1 hypothetical protein [Pelomonas sp. SE-A7]